MDKTTYEEIGIVVEVGKALPYDSQGNVYFINKGDKVFFDSWLAARYPTGNGEDFLWLVKWEDIRAVEYADKIPE